MGTKKIKAVRINTDAKLVQIKTNRGPNHTLDGEQFEKFVAVVNEYMARDNVSKDIAMAYAAQDYLEGL